VDSATFTGVLSMGAVLLVTVTTLRFVLKLLWSLL
jgi:hypothetical protein